MGTKSEGKRVRGARACLLVAKASASALPLAGEEREQGQPDPEKRATGASISPAPFLLGGLARGVANVAGGLLLGLQCRLAYGHFGGGESLGFLSFPLGLRCKFGGTGDLLGPFGVTFNLGGIALDPAAQALRLEGRAPLGDCRVTGGCPKLLQHGFLGRGGVALAVFQIWASEAAHLSSGMCGVGWGTRRCQAFVRSQ